MFHSPTQTVSKRRQRNAPVFAAALAFASAALINPSPVHAGVYKSLHDFAAYPSGGNPTGGLVRAADGTMYGVTEHGGEHGVGVIFSISANDVYTDIYSFKGGIDPAMPVEGLSLGPDGWLYGATNNGGLYNHGTLYKFNPSTKVLTVLYSFKDPPFYGPTPPQVAADGSFYGTNSYNTGSITYRWTASGGLKQILAYRILLTAGADGYVYGCTPNMLFKFNSDGSIQKIRDLSLAEGTRETSSLTPGPGGILWGYAHGGGPHDGGVIYKVGTNGQGFYIVHANAATDAVNPSGPITVGPDNRLYGIGRNSTGSASYYSMGVDGKIKILLNLSSSYADGPDRKIAIGHDGRPYAEETSLTSWGDGRVIKITPAGDAKVVKDFRNVDLASSIAAPVRLANGDYIGTASQYGVFGFGGIYRLSADGKYTILYNFLRPILNISASLTLGADGNAYTLAGGQFCKVSADGTVTATDILPAEAANLSEHSLTLGSDGLLYAVYNQAAYTVSYAGIVTKVADVPVSRYADKLALASDGRLYSPLQFDVNGDLHVYWIAPSGVVKTIKYAAGGDPSMSTTPFKTGPDGALYGVAVGTTKASFVYKINVKTAKFTKVYTFPLNDPLRPIGNNVVARADGTVFGAAVRSSANQLDKQGVIYAISPTGQFSIVANIPKHVLPAFGVANALELEGDHAIVGVSNGGLYGDGALFRITGL